MNTFNGVRIDTFQRQYRVYSGAFCGKSHIDNGGKIILPTSALDEIARLNIVYPMLFKITNNKHSTHTHCGVLEFSAEEGRVYIPFWMQEHLRLNPGQMVTVTSATLPKGTFVKLRPQQKAFIEVSDPKAVLEQKLRNFSCLTKGDTIMINYNSQNYLIDITEVATPSGQCSAVSIVETDVSVEFERPLDMPPSPVKTAPTEDVFQIPIPVKKKKSQEKEEEKEEPKFVPFQAGGRRLDGKSIKMGSSPPVKQGVPPPAETKPAPTTTTTTQPPSTGGGGMVFGSSKKTPSTTSTTAAKPPVKKEEEKPQEKKFNAFSGQGRSLK
ncbi:ubiquitin fusion degradation protein [Acrasis kona]|uniref:Ubiquitin fusion degradation protein n=1 Tax=Acrasis kona TaxID=1008807 RepID=A0AAW2ZQV3_9EUKA